jgi:hypothetical protein
MSIAQRQTNCSGVDREVKWEAAKGSQDNGVT